MTSIIMDSIMQISTTRMANTVIQPALTQVTYEHLLNGSFSHISMISKQIIASLTAKSILHLSRCVTNTRFVRLSAVKTQISLDIHPV